MSEKKRFEVRVYRANELLKIFKVSAVDYPQASAKADVLCDAYNLDWDYRGVSEEC